MIHKKQESGVVLLSCLVFLLLILALVRISLNMSRMEEYKVATDIENAKSHEYAVMALQKAELELKEDLATQDVATLLTNRNYHNMSRDVCEKTDPKDSSKKIRVPFWQCVKWGYDLATNKPNGYYHGEQVSAPSFEAVAVDDLGSDVAGSNGAYKKEVQKVPPPEYVIELIDGSTFGLRGQFLARVTAMGYGTKGDGETVANTMLQATYLIPDDS